MTEQENTAVTHGYCVILESHEADKKVSVIKVVRELTGLGLKEAKDLVEIEGPTILTSISNCSLEVAYLSVGKLTAEGASAYIRLVDDMGDPDDKDAVGPAQIQNWRNDIYEVCSMVEVASRAAGIENDLHMSTFLQKAARDLGVIADEMANGGRSMSADEVPSRSARLPLFDDIEVNASEHDGKIRVVYHGAPEDFVAAGIVTQQMLAMGHKGDRSRRFDCDGDKWSISAWWVGINCGQPRRRYRAAVTKSPGAASRLPGVPQALAVYAAREAYLAGRRDEHRREMQDWEQQSRRPPPLDRPKLTQWAKCHWQPLQPRGDKLA